jgi:dihydrofolate synthase / folylpolyglutamate synthase
MDFPDSVAWLYKLGNETRVIRLGLQAMETLLAALNHPQSAYRVIHVAGTNGKGSTCAMIEAGLRSAGYHTGLFTSPHLVSPTERIRIHGRDVSEEAFAAAFQTVHAVSLSLVSAGSLEQHPSYFECVTAMAHLLFRDSGVEVAVLETGLGGRLDATNANQPTLTVLTRIGMDHQQYLGDTIEKIAFEKAGILKPRVPAVVSPQRDEAMQVIMQRAEQLQCPLHRVDEDRWSYSPDVWGGTLQRGSAIRVPLAGEHQAENAATAALALARMGVSPTGITNANWPARLERVRQQPDIVIDGAHNADGAAALAAWIRRAGTQRPVWLVFGVMRDKEVGALAELLFPLATRRIYTRADQARSLEPEALLAWGEGTVTQSVSEAMEQISTAPANALVVVAGSLFVAGEARALLLRT